MSHPAAGRDAHFRRDTDAGPEAAGSAARVFISYAREDADHDDAVRALWIYLRSKGIDAKCDLPAAERRQDWPLWMLEQVREAKFVLIIASPEYRRRGDGQAPADEGRGVQWEAALIRNEVYADRRKTLEKFLPVILPGRSMADIPTWLSPTAATYYDLTGANPGSAERLLRLLTDQPYELEPPIGPAPLLPSRADQCGDLLSSPRISSDIAPFGIELDDGGRRLTIENTGAHDARSIAPLSRLFLHFFDPHFLDEVSGGKNAYRIAVEATRATRLAVLTAETVFVPAASYIESDLCARVINEYKPLFSDGHIVLVGGEANLVDFASSKLLQYKQGGERYQKYAAFIESKEETPPFRSRRSSTTADIEAAWYEKLGDLKPLVAGISSSQFLGLESKWATVPSALEGRAFTPEYAVTALFGPEIAPGAQIIVAHRAGSYINSAYFRSYTTELQAGVVTDLTYLHSPHTGSTTVDLPFRALMRALANFAMLEAVLAATPDELLELRVDTRVAAAFTSAVLTRM